MEVHLLIPVAGLLMLIIIRCSIKTGCYCRFGETVKPFLLKKGTGVANGLGNDIALVFVIKIHQGGLVAAYLAANAPLVSAPPTRIRYVSPTIERILPPSAPMVIGLFLVFSILVLLGVMQSSGYPVVKNVPIGLFTSPIGLVCHRIAM
jgi:hypothetical protein